MHDYFIKNKFNLLNSNLFNNIYRRDSKYFKEEVKNDRRKVYLDKEENEKINKNEELIDRMKKDFHEQLIYSYYNNFNEKSVEEIKDKNNDLKNIYDYNNINKKSLLNYNSNEISEDICLKNKEVKEDILYNEFKKLKNDVLVLQMMNVNLQKQLLSNHLMNSSKVIPQNIIINNKTEVASNAISQIQDNKKKKGFLYLLFKKILRSRFNQMLFVSSIFLSFFLINKHWQRALKVSQLEKRINSNILLRSVRLFEETLGIRKLSYI
ncbi:microneme associated antigen, putative [Plasmodium gallinaceum]|uniref:Microneme associated antigen, putative n=1 Tax=Plasmodium gallinaceum TaxID=5849 RepID=A0A1J1GTC5_PLAGA|nr:microneme associated antigen, putative [Plasmodium gallinaceum]CRG94299.1 microneme associated antigen, putative [Plasmodium gallinaceum]